MRSLNVSLVVLLIVAGASTADPSVDQAYFQSGILVANFDTDGETLWIGASLKDGSGRVRDLTPVMVSGSSTHEWTVGVPGLSSSTYRKARVSLWEDYNSRTRLMEHRVADTGWFDVASGWR